ncbi:MarR family winged helix-turn-helix transcriptional regulator [Nocardia sp. CWNU-33]|uniref:MarR family winged helix-turn-helix transcriptional regulator n=1 Tax=Nocardia sp. CWNU-33 TaxID=3392117 RepID=UPI00398F895D
MARRPDTSADSKIDRDMCRLVHQFAHQLDTNARRVADELGLTPTQVVMLRELSEPITARELAARIFCEPSNATFVLDRLEQQGLIERHPHPTDRRAKQIVLTKTGHDRRAEVLVGLHTDSPLSPLTTVEQETLRDLLQRLVAPE